MKCQQSQAFPRMHVCIMVVGTQGDIQPFIGLGKRLEEIGHEVTIATHLAHHPLVVQKHKMKFHPLAGDPKQLSSWMVRTGGSVLGEAMKPHLLPAKTRMVRDIIRSTLPEGDFCYDAIIANPPVMGHIHIAEAFGVPLHIFFPQPWYYGTKQFPHPMAGLAYREGGVGNYASYKIFETLTWSSFGGFINRWRVRDLGMLPIHAVEAKNTNFIVSSRVPFTAMWSPSLAPKPFDWPAQCRVVGTFVTKQATIEDVGEKYRETTKWLNSGCKPIFVGFGSMVIKDPSHLQFVICEAAKQANVRIILQSCWTKMNIQDDSSLVHCIGPCPHDWLLPQCSAVVHHGGAGTVAAGLRHGLPTLVCPFFADQYMWGNFVEKAGVGPKPCPASKLTTDRLVGAFRQLTNEEFSHRATLLASRMNAENGIEDGLGHFLDSLPRSEMLCDVSTLLGESALARYELIGTNSRDIIVCPEVLAVLKMNRTFRWTNIFASCTSSEIRAKRRVYAVSYCEHTFVNYHLAGRVETFYQGLVSAVIGLSAWSIGSVRHIYLQPRNCYRMMGICGVVPGLLLVSFCVLWDVLMGLVVFIDRFMLGILNGLFCAKLDYVVDWQRYRRRNTRRDARRQLVDFMNSGIQEPRRHEILKAMDIVAEASRLFRRCQAMKRSPRSRVSAFLPALRKCLSSEDCPLQLSSRQNKALEMLLGSLKHDLEACDGTASDDTATVDNDSSSLARTSTQQGSNDHYISFTQFLEYLSIVIRDEDASPV